MILQLSSHSAAQTRQLGVALGQRLQPGDVICLYGDLGAGKTTFAAGLGAGWGAVEALTSPTFVILHLHERPQDEQLLYHLDAYRLASADAADSVGLEEVFSGQHVVLVEWAGQIAEWLPADALSLHFHYGAAEDSREIEIKAPSSRAQVLAQGLAAAQLTDSGEEG